MAKDFVPLSNLHDQNENPSYDHEYESLNNVRASAATEEPSIVSRGSSGNIKLFLQIIFL